MPGPGHRWLDTRAFWYRPIDARKKKAFESSSEQSVEEETQTGEAAKTPAGVEEDRETADLEKQGTETEACEFDEDPGFEQRFNEDSSPEFEENPPEPESEKEEQALPSLEEAEALISEKTKLLMDELFRARIQRVKRIDPKEIL